MAGRNRAPASPHPAAKGRKAFAPPPRRDGKESGTGRLYGAEMTLEGWNCRGTSTKQARKLVRLAGKLSHWNTQFYPRLGDTQMTLARDDSGTVTGLVVHQGGRDIAPGRIARD